MNCDTRMYICTRAFCGVASHPTELLLLLYRTHKVLLSDLWTCGLCVRGYRYCTAALPLHSLCPWLPLLHCPSKLGTHNLSDVGSRSAISKE